MNILVTGAKGMGGTALVANLKNIKENKNRTRPGLGNRSMAKVRKQVKNCFSSMPKKRGPRLPCTGFRT